MAEYENQYAAKQFVVEDTNVTGVDRAYKELEQQIQRLSIVRDNIRDKLKPVLKQDYPHDKEEKDMTQPATPRLESLQQFINLLRSYVDDMELLYNRIEV